MGDFPGRDLPSTLEIENWGQDKPGGKDFEVLPVSEVGWSGPSAGSVRLPKLPAGAASERPAGA